jgi:malonyl-CoA/methylmalonyl-CoA synthetase
LSANAFSLFRSRFPSDLSAPFLESPDGSTLSYGEMIAFSGRLANVLRGWGIKAGQRLAVQVEKSVAALALYLAALREGAVYLPLNPAYTENELRYFLSDSEPAALICGPRAAAAMKDLASLIGGFRVETLGTDGEGSLIEAAHAASTAFEDAERDTDDIAAILYTSGTTGRSKGAMLSHGNLSSNAKTLREAWRFAAADRLLHALPLFHSHGLFVATNVTLCAGSSLLFMPSFDADEVIRLLPRASVMMGVPTFYTRLLARPELTRDLVQHMRLFVSGSAPLPAETHKEFYVRSGHAILERYGMTETNMNTSNPYEGERAPGSVGFPLPGIEIRIADPESGKEQPKGEIGVIEIRGPNVFKGYWRMPEKTRQEFRDDGFFISGDLGFIDPLGYLRIVGRARDLIISGGLNVYPAEVETAIEALDGVAECAVIGVPHPDFGEGVVAVVAPRPGASLDERSIQARLAERLAKFKQPKRVFFDKEIPRNAMGKVQKKDLRERYKDVFAPARDEDQDKISA